MKKTVHYSDGCAWADGSIYSADTRQTKDWAKVTCKHCRRRFAVWTDATTVKRKSRVRMSIVDESFSDYMRAMLVLLSS